MKVLPNVGCVAGQDGHDYQFQSVYRDDSRGGLRGPGGGDLESILGMCRRCGDIYMQPVTRLERPREERDDAPAQPFGGTIEWHPNHVEGGVTVTGASSVTRATNNW